MLDNIQEYVEPVFLLDLSRSDLQGDTVVKWELEAYSSSLRI